MKNSSLLQYQTVDWYNVKLKISTLINNLIVKLAIVYLQWEKKKEIKEENLETYTQKKGMHRKRFVHKAHVEFIASKQICPKSSNTHTHTHINRENFCLCPIWRIIFDSLPQVICQRISFDKMQRLAHTHTHTTRDWAINYLYLKKCSNQTFFQRRHFQCIKQYHSMKQVTMIHCK